MIDSYNSSLVPSSRYRDYTALLDYNRLAGRKHHTAGTVQDIVLDEIAEVCLFVVTGPHMFGYLAKQYRYMHVYMC